MLSFSDWKLENLPIFKQIGDVVRFECFNFQRDNYGTVKAWYNVGRSRVKSFSIDSVLGGKKVEDRTFVKYAKWSREYFANNSMTSIEWSKQHPDYKNKFDVLLQIKKIQQKKYNISLYREIHFIDIYQNTNIYQL